jgi:hypothetical protein
MARLKPLNLSRPIAPAQSVTAQQAFLGNVYNGGAWVIHTLRNYIGDSTFFMLLRRWAYPDQAMENVTNGKQCRLATTDEFRQIAEQTSGKALDWFFSVYLRQPGLPQLTVARKDTTITLRWAIANNIRFPMPVEVQVGSQRIKVDMTSGTGIFSAPTGVTPTIDPDARILMASPRTVDVEVSDETIPRDFAIRVYPNPFNPSTTLRIDVPRRMRVTGQLFSITGQRINDVLDIWLEPGTHSVPIHLGNQSSAAYFVVVRGEERIVTSKVVLLR